MPRPREKYWYAIRVFRNMDFMKAQFTRDRIETFVPYVIRESVVNSRNKAENVPLMSSLIFLKASEKYIIDLKNTHFDQMMYYCDFFTRAPGRIDDAEMELFMRITSPLAPGIEFFDNDGPKFHEGEKVEILEGPFKGVKGRIIRIGRDRKVLVRFSGNFSFRLNIAPKDLKSLDALE